MPENVFEEQNADLGNGGQPTGGVIREDAPQPVGRPQQQMNPLGSIPMPAAGHKIKATFQTEYDPAQVAALQGQRGMIRPPLQSRFHVAAGRDVNAGEWLDNNCSNPQYSDYYITVRRKSPANMAGLVISAERRIPLMRLGELVQAVQELSGGGSYCYDVFSVDHQPQLRGNFTIPQNDFPPKHPDNLSAGTAEARTNDAPEVAEKKKELEVKRLQKQIEEIDRKELREDERKRESEMSEAAEARKEMVQFMRESREETRRIMEDSKKETQTLVLQMMTMMKDVIGSMKQTDGGGSNVVAEAVKAQGEFLANSIKTQAEQSSKFMEMMINMNKGSKDESAAAAKIQADSQTKMVEMVVNNVKTMAEVSKGSGDKMQELFMGLLTKQINNNPMKEVLDLMQKGEDRAAEKYEMVMDIMERNRPPVTDPNADPFSNIIAAAIDRFTRGGGGGQKAVGIQPSGMTPEQVNDFAKAIAPVVQAHMQYQQQNPQTAAQAALPPPAQMPPAQNMQPQAVQAPQPIHSADLFEGGDLDDDDYPTMQTPVMPQQPQSSAPQQPPAPQPKTREEAILMAGGEENFSRYVTTQIIQMATKDAQAKAPRASWIEPAGVWLTDALQRAIADAADIPHKALVIQQKCDPAAFEALKAVTTPESYKVFCDGLAALSEMVKSKQV